MYRCEKCGKDVVVKYGSGRFCSASCAHSHIVSSEHKLKTSLSLKGKYKRDNKVYQDIVCGICGKLCKTKSGYSKHIKNHQKLYKIFKTELDVTDEFIVKYLKDNQRCEICGKHTSDLPKGRSLPTRLCIDHNHITNTFRGVLCQKCNKSLGWYEQYSDAITKYLTK